MTDINLNLNLGLNFSEETKQWIERVEKIVFALSGAAPGTTAVTPEDDSQVPEDNKYGHIVFASDDWNRVHKYRNLRWKTEGEKLVLKYYAGEVNTTWSAIERLQKLPEKKMLEEIRTLSKSNNKKTAIRTFITCLTEGLISKPSNPDAELVNNCSKFQAEEDQDAAFRPFVTPFISTRPDSNSGKVEGTLEV